MPVARLTLASRVVASQDQVSANLAGESVVLGMQDGVYYGLDAVATRIWEHIRQPRTIEDVVAMLERDYEVSRERAEVDVITFVTDLRSHGLIDVVPA